MEAWPSPDFVGWIDGSSPWTVRAPLGIFAPVAQRADGSQKHQDVERVARGESFRLRLLLHGWGRCTELQPDGCSRGDEEEHTLSLTAELGVGEIYRYDGICTQRRRFSSQLIEARLSRVPKGVLDCLAAPAQDVGNTSDEILEDVHTE